MSRLQQNSIDPIPLLLRRIPDWAERIPKPSSRPTVLAQPVQASGKPTPPFMLELFQRAGEAFVCESAGGRLPASCPERHINGNGTFCIGYEAGKRIETEQAADLWWTKLMVHLLCQDTAGRTGVWPSYAALSHGDAGGVQLIAEAFGAERGMLDAVRDAARGEGPIHAAIQLISEKDPKRLINGRAACVCGPKKKWSAQVLRRECEPASCLVFLEQERRRKEAEFWNERRDWVCCGSMVDCPLRKKAKTTER